MPSGLAALRDGSEPAGKLGRPRRHLAPRPESPPLLPVPRRPPARDRLKCRLGTRRLAALGSRLLLAFGCWLMMVWMIAAKGGGRLISQRPSAWLETSCRKSAPNPPAPRFHPPRSPPRIRRPSPQPNPAAPTPSIPHAALIIPPPPAPQAPTSILVSVVHPLTPPHASTTTGPLANTNPRRPHSRPPSMPHTLH